MMMGEPAVVAVMIMFVVAMVVIFVAVVVVFAAVAILAAVSFHCPVFYLQFVAKNIHSLSVQLVAEKTLPHFPPSPPLPF